MTVESNAYNIESVRSRRHDELIEYFSPSPVVKCDVSRGGV